MEEGKKQWQFRSPSIFKKQFKIPRRDDWYSPEVSQSEQIRISIDQAIRFAAIRHNRIRVCGGEPLSFFDINRNIMYDIFKLR